MPVVSINFSAIFSTQLLIKENGEGKSEFTLAAVVEKIM